MNTLFKFSFHIKIPLLQGFVEVFHDYEKSLSQRQMYWIILSSSDIKTLCLSQLHVVEFSSLNRLCLSIWLESKKKKKTPEVEEVRRRALKEN